MGDFLGNTLCIRFVLRNPPQEPSSYLYKLSTRIQSELIVTVEEEPFPPPFTLVIKWLCHYLDSAYPNRKLEELLIARVTDSSIYPKVKLLTRLEQPDFYTPEIPLYLDKQNKAVYKFKLEHIWKESSSVPLESQTIEFTHIEPHQSMRELYGSAKYLDKFIKADTRKDNFCIYKFHFSTAKRDVFG